MRSVGAGDSPAVFYVKQCNAVRTAVRTMQENHAASRINTQYIGGEGGIRTRGGY